ncbi:uncharacterized protein LOC127242760 [Andrographis paniculata]|uniref:uncharacterized protein LOC127242760 n=1 Tax=Andrographis paniculata TaxID=175694 RepID=UPI0021E82F75|nr:uncharacterized protein LOC127242760 [Andrographis paniculata]
MKSGTTKHRRCSGSSMAKNCSSGGSSKDLLQLEHNSSAVASTSCLGSKLFVWNKDDSVPQPGAPIQKPPMFPVPKSDVLGKVKDFLGVMSESNRKLLHNAKENPENYDIEVLNGKESEVIELDLMLGIADLHTPEAVAAAESAMAGYQPVTRFSESSSESDSEEDNDRKDEINEEVSNPDSKEHVNLEPKEDTGSSKYSRERSGKQKPPKRPKIVELS